MTGDAHAWIACCPVCGWASTSADSSHAEIAAALHGIMRAGSHSAFVQENRS